MESNEPPVPNASEEESITTNNVNTAEGSDTIIKSDHKNVTQFSILQNKLASLAIDGSEPDTPPVASVSVRHIEMPGSHAIDVADIMKEEGVFFVHGILNLDVPVANTLLKTGVNWRTKLNIAAFLHPNLACSSVSKGDTVDNIWSKMGILIKGGKILGASTGDNRTQAKTLTHRTKRDGHLSIPTQEEVLAAIRGDRKDNDKSIQRAYNEFNIAGASIAGFYISRDASYLDTAVSNAIPTHREIHEWVEEVLHMPVYIHVGDTFSPARYNQATKQYETVETETVTPTDIVDTPSYLPSQEFQQRQITYLMENSPFVEFTTGLKEISYARSYGYGKDSYMMLNRQAILDRYQSRAADKTTIEICQYSQPNHKKVLWKIYYGNQDPYYYMEMEDTRTGKKETKGYRELSSTFIVELGRYNQHEIVYITDEANPINDYVTRMRHIIGVNKSRADRLVEEHRDEEVKKYIEESRNIGFHMYGVADQAVALGDVQSANIILMFAKTVIPETEARELLAKRLGKDGEIITTTKDVAELSGF